MCHFLSSLLALLSLLSLACGRGHGSSEPEFSLTVEPGQVRLVPGLSQTATLTLQPQPGFNGVVELSAVGLVAGVEARFTPASLTLANGVAAQATLVLTATETVLPGKNTLALQAAWTDQTQVADLVVDIPVTAFFTVLTYRGVDPANFAYLAYQDGAGPWLAVAGQAGLYRLPISDPGGRFGVLLGDVCRGDSTSTWITNGFFSTLGEVQMLQALVFCNPQPGPPPVTFDLSGALAGASGGGVLISTNSGLWSFAAGTTDYALKLVKGKGDLVAATYPSLQDYLPSRLIVERGRDAQAPSTRDFDFATQGGDPLAPLAIQKPALDADETFQGTVQYHTSRGQVAILGYGRELAAYAPFPPAAAETGDAYLYSFQAYGSNHSRSLQASGSDPPGPLAPRFPSNIQPFDLVASTGANPRLSLSWTTVTPAPNVHEAVITQQLPGKQAYCYLYFGKSWHNGAAAMSWTQPDLAAVPGFDPGFFPQPGATAQVTIYQSGAQTRQPQAGMPQAGTPQAGMPSNQFLSPLWDASLPLAAPPGYATPSSGRPGIAGMHLKVQGSTVKAAISGSSASGTPWTEYWSANRTQTVVP